MDFFDHVKGAFDTLYEEGEEGMPKMMTIATVHSFVLFLFRKPRNSNMP